MQANKVALIRQPVQMQYVQHKVVKVSFECTPQRRYEYYFSFRTIVQTGTNAVSDALRCAEYH